MIRRALGLGGVALVCLGASAASAVAPDGPRLAFVKWQLRPERIELLTADASGSLPFRLAGGGVRSRPLPHPLVAPSWSPDGNLIAFTAFTGPLGEEGPPQTRLWVAAADGSGARPIPGGRGGYGPVFAPDGHTVAFTRIRDRERHTRSTIEVFRGASAWIADLDRGEPRRLTPWRNGLFHVPSSFSPDGSTLAMTRLDERGGEAPEAVLFNFANGRAGLLAKNASQPVFSPDGGEVAFVRGRLRRVPGGRRSEETTDLYVLSLGDFALRRLVATPTLLELSPSWDPSGERLAYVQLRPARSRAAFLGGFTALAQINADGTCRTRIFETREAAVFGAAWQPGPGRAAGRIGC